MKLKLAIAGLALAAAAGAGVLSYGAGRTSHPWVQEYTAGQGNIQGNVDTESFLKADGRFEIGADAQGIAVFKDPDAALEALEEKYALGLEAIQREFGLLPVKLEGPERYKTYGWQVSGGTEEERAQARFVTRFMDIYENSF